MTIVKRYLFASVIVFALCSCKRKVHDWNVALIEGYSLTYYEAAPDDAFFIVNNQDKAVVAPQVTKVACNDQFIWGEVEPKGDKAFDPTPAGLFVIDAATGNLIKGLDQHKFAKDYPTLPLSSLAPSSSFWKPRQGNYQPRQH